MKATEVLEWICREGINGEKLFTTRIYDDTESKTDEFWTLTFGGVPSRPIPAGKYIYYYYSDISENIFFDGFREPDGAIQLSGNDYIFFYRLDD